jgi:biopolymer transport protein ExbD
MRFFSLLTFFCVAVFTAGCTTSRVVEDTRSRSLAGPPTLVRDETPPDIIINKFGDITFHGKRVTPERVASVVISAKIPKTKKIRILVPEQRDHVLMRTITDNLLQAGYVPVFVTDQKGKAIAKDKGRP